jgi:hypothetical protein
LRDFPKKLGIRELKKGYFPYKFNTTDNWNYIGEYPDPSYYSVETKKKKDREEFMTWYDSVKHEMFNFQQQMYEYCKSDVDILRQGCIIFRQLFLDVANIDPFQYITITSVCFAIYRNECLPENTVALVEENPTDVFSIKSIKWLKYLSLKHNNNIKHACNGGEQKVGSLKVDGICGNTVYQFHGCYFHGCPTCFNPATVNKHSGKQMSDLYDATLKHEEAIKNKYELVTIWEHEFDSNKDMTSITLSEYDLIEPPKYRDAFYGGRTEPFKLIYDFQHFNQKGKYIDVCSLYPTVMYYDRYPIGHPVKIIKPQQIWNDDWFGFIHCKILPPRDLYLPVLPYRVQKLLFGLCGSCMNNLDSKCSHVTRSDIVKIKCQENCNVKDCTQCKIAKSMFMRHCQQCLDARNSACSHSHSERAIVGHWTTIEVAKALELGYRIIETYEVSHFEQSSTELWKSYIKKFLKIKLETSPSTCSEYEYRMKAARLGIELGELKQNPGLRFISKICLNSLWGKLGQRPTVTHREYIDNEREFYATIINDKIDNLSIALLNNASPVGFLADNTLAYITYNEKENFVKLSYNTNIFIACYTTAHARLRLFDMMHRLGEAVCYCDTDSIIYVKTDDNKDIVQLGDSLGEWTDELGDNHIDFWCCTAPKDYGFLLNNGTSKGKVKGFRTSAQTEQLMTIENRVKLINGIVQNIEIQYDQFNIRDAKLFTKQMIKQWSFSFDKRRTVHINDHCINTVPFGY